MKASVIESIVGIVILAIVERKVAFMWWNRRMGGAERLRHGVRVPRCWHVGDGRVANDVRMRDDVAVERIRVLDAVVFECAMEDGSLIGPKITPHTAFELQIFDVIVHGIRTSDGAAV